MPLNNRLIHPRLFEHLRPTFWRDVVSIEMRTSSTLVNAIGGPETDETLNPWVWLHQNVSCNIGIQTEALGPKTSEVREPLASYDSRVRQCMLNGYYPLVTTSMRAVDDEGTAYNIKGVVNDSSKNMTELVLELIT